jgi:Sec-independent protein translocase protein TatA
VGIVVKTHFAKNLPNLAKALAAVIRGVRKGKAVVTSQGELDSPK